MARQKSFIERFRTSPFQQALVVAYIAFFVLVGGLAATEHVLVAFRVFFLGGPAIGIGFWGYTLWRWLIRKPVR